MNEKMSIDELKAGFPNALKELRKSAGESKKDVAESIGLKKKVIKRLEAGTMELIDLPPDIKIFRNLKTTVNRLEKKAEKRGLKKIIKKSK